MTESELGPIAAALRFLRRRKQLTQKAAAQLNGAPDHRTLSHWECRRKVPSLRLLTRYLGALSLDFRALQDAIDEVNGTRAATVDERLVALEKRMSNLERTVVTEPRLTEGS